VEQAVIVHLRMNEPFGSPEECEAIYALKDRLIAVMEAAAIGEFDGHEFGDHKCVFYIYGPNADEILAIVEPTLRANALTPGGHVVKRYGMPGARELRIAL